MKKFTLLVPGNITYISEWQEFYDNFPRFPHILDKQVPGCGFTEWALTNPDNVILCSPRNMLILNKYEQHLDDVFRVHNSKYDVDPEVDRDLNKPEKDFIEQLHHEMSKEEKIGFTKKLWNDIRIYLEKRKSLGKPAKILVTYDSFRILRDILESQNKFNEFQVIVDEFQTIFTDSRFKSNTELEFVGTLKDVSKVCYVSATPMIESYLELLDEFKDLPYYELDWVSLNKNRLIRPTLKVNIINSIFSPLKRIIESYKTGDFATWMMPGEIGIRESREAMIYVNSVNNIIQIIKKFNLSSEEVTILCSNTKANLERIQNKLGKNFNIGKVPLKNEERKMFTFCTRTVYLGADFYSDNARSFILSDANLETLAVDISLDLPQILGRQRNEDNPWKNQAEFYYKPYIKVGKEESKEVFQQRISKKLELSQKHIANFNSAADKDAYMKLIQNNVDSMHYQEDYVSINRHQGNNLVPVINKLVLVAEQRAYDIQQIDYADRFSVFNTLRNSVGGFDEETNSKIFELLDLIGNAQTIREKLKLFCEYPISNEGREYVKNNIGDPSILEYLNLSIEDLRKTGYNTTKIREIFGMKVYDWSGIEKEVREEFKIGDRLNKAEIKNKLGKIYKKYNYPGQAKANDLEKWFEIKDISMRENGKRTHGFEIVKNSETQ